MFNKKKKLGSEELHEVKGAGYTATRKVKRDKTVNRRAGLHDKVKNLEGEARVKRCKPLAIKHVRRMRKVAAVASLGVVGVVAVVGVGFFAPKKTTELDKELETVCYEVPTDGSKPTDHTLVENVGYMNYVLQNQEWWSSEMFSTVIAMGFSQTVETYKQYYDDVLISADVAKGFSSKATQFCVANGVVMWRPSANKNFDKMNTPWSTGEAQGMTVKTYKKNRGFPPSEFSVYVLNEDTIANAYDYSVTDNGNGTYSMTLNLNVNTGVDETSADYYYKLQMKVTGDLYDCPTIHTTSVTYTFDESWRVLEFEISDSYNAAISANFAPGCTSNTKVKFDYSEENAKNTFWNDYFSSQYDRLKDTLVDDDKVEENTDNAMGYLTGAFASVLSDGAVFKLGLKIDNLDLSGVVNVEMPEGKFSGLSAKLGDILVWLDGETLYINDGSSKYKLNINGLLSTQSEGGDILGGFDVAGLVEQMTTGTFTLNEETGVATLQSEVELFGLKISMEFEFQKTENGVELNFLKAQIPLGEKVVEANLRFGKESDKPAIPTDTASYTDILNNGVALDISLEAGELKLDGIAKIIMQNGGFAGVYATLGDMGVYYDCPANMLYLSIGEAKYKLDISALGTGENGSSISLGSFDISSVLNDVLKNLSTTENSLGTKLNINIDAFESVLEAALDIQLNGGLKVNAALTLGEQNVNVTAALTNKEVALPDLTGYEDILNGEITLDVGLTLVTGLADEAGNRDEVALSGKVALCLANGNLTEIRADFGGLAVYYEFSTNSLYLKVGTTKAMLNLAEMNFSDVGALSTLEGGNLITVDLPTVIKELLTNLVAESKTISTNVNLTVLDGIVPVWAEIDLSDGLGVKAGLTVFGIDAVASVGISQTPLASLSADEKAEYIDVLKNGHKIIEYLIGDHISATVEGKIYSGEEKYAEVNGVKYSFVASLEYDNGKVTVEEGVETDTKAYIHLNVGLTAPHPEDDSLYLDVYLLDANPVTGADGKTTGGYTADGSYDVYLSVSKYAENAVPLRIYAPVDEILTLASMVCAAAHLDQINVETSKELTAAIGEIADLLDSMLISKYLPQSVTDKFASLGDSLIPQILGVSLEELLNNLFGNIGETMQNTQNINISLSDAFVSSITATEENLRFVLDSSLIYNKEIAESDNLVVNFERILREGTYFVEGVSLDNIFFGENEINKLNLGMKLNYGEIARPDKNTAFAEYLNAAGLDTLLNGLVNSATHKIEGASDKYDLNHYYLLNGSITASLKIVGNLNIPIEIDVKSAAIYIDPETNKVSADIHLSYDGKQVIVTAINGKHNEVYITVRNDMIYIRRIEDGKKITRIMPLDVFLSVENIMDNINFIFNFGSVVADNLNGIDLNKPSGVSFENKDFGGILDYILAGYKLNETESGAQWTITVNGEKGSNVLDDAVGMNMSNIPITFNADKQADGSYCLKSLGIASSEAPATMTLFGSISLTFYGSLNYLNPQEEVYDRPDDTTVKLNSESLEELNGLSWFDVLGGDKFEEICKHTDWNTVLSDLNCSYLGFGEGFATAIGTLKYEYATDLENTSFAEYGAEQTVLYNTSTRNRYSYYNSPSLDEIPTIDSKKLIWQETEDPLLVRAVYERYNVTVESNVEIDGWTKDGDVYKITASYLVSDTIDFNYSPVAVSSVYKFVGFFDADGNEVTEWTVTGDAVIYAKWTGKEINVTYQSDVALSNLTNAEGNVATWHFGETNQIAECATSQEGVMFLGWFMEAGSGESLTYIYCASADAVKDYLKEVGVNGESVSVNLWAVWIEDVNSVVINYTARRGALNNWKIGGYYTGGTFASGKSSEIANATEKLKISKVEVYYRIFDFNSQGYCEAVDTLNSGKPYDITSSAASQTFRQDKEMTNTKNTGYVGASIYVTFSYDGKVLHTVDGTGACDRADEYKDANGLYKQIDFTKTKAEQYS